MTEEKQISELRAMVRRRVPQFLTWSCVVLSVLLIGLGLSTQQKTYFIFGAFAVFLAYLFYDAAPYITAAARALDFGVSGREIVLVEIDRTSDNDSFKLQSETIKHGVWRFEFIPIGGWIPAEGKQEATIYRLSDTPWPALVKLSGGIVWPRQKPKEINRDDSRGI